MSLVVLSSVLMLGHSGCESDGYTVNVLLVTDYAPGTEVARVETTLDSEPGASVTIGPSDSLSGAGHTVATLTGVSPGPHVIEVRLYDARGASFTARAIAVPVGHDVSVRVSIARGCTGVVCPRLGDPPDHTTCSGGACVADGMACATVDECGSSSFACVVSSCEGGVCRNVPTDALCAPGERCSPTAGCVPGGIDSSAPDSAVDSSRNDSAVDSSVGDSAVDSSLNDSGEPDAGACNCIHPTDECLGYRCYRAGAVCNVLIACPPGYACEVDRCVCSDLAVCGVSCGDDADCGAGMECDLVDGICRRERDCIGSWMCEAGEICDGTCTPAGSAMVGEVCNGNRDCMTGLCRGTSGSGGPGVCIASCTTNADCTGGLQCDGESIGGSGFGCVIATMCGACASDQRCDFGTCEASGDPCTANSDCPPTHRCTTSFHSPPSCEPSARSCGATEVEDRSAPSIVWCLSGDACWLDADHCPSGYACTVPWRAAVCGRAP